MSLPLRSKKTLKKFDPCTKYSHALPGGWEYTTIMDSFAVLLSRLSFSSFCEVSIFNCCFPVFCARELAQRSRRTQDAKGRAVLGQFCKILRELTKSAIGGTEIWIHDLFHSAQKRMQLCDLRQEHCIKSLQNLRYEGQERAQYIEPITRFVALRRRTDNAESMKPTADVLTEEPSTSVSEGARSLDTSSSSTARSETH